MCVCVEPGEVRHRGQLNNQLRWPAKACCWWGSNNTSSNIINQVLQGLPTTNCGWHLNCPPFRYSKEHGGIPQDFPQVFFIQPQMLEEIVFLNHDLVSGSFPSVHLLPLAAAHTWSQWPTLWVNGSTCFNIYTSCFTFDRPLVLYIGDIFVLLLCINIIALSSLVDLLIWSFVAH